MLNYQHLLNDYTKLKQHNHHFVLITLISVSGSTYRKAGARMLISEDGRMSGMVSGGCLEGGLLLEAKKIFASGRTKTIDIDMRYEDENSWGLVLGCAGYVRLHLQLLSVDQKPNLLDLLAHIYTERESAWLVSEVLDGANEGRWCGLLADKSFGNLPTELTNELLAGVSSLGSTGSPEYGQIIRLGNSATEFFIERIPPAFSLLVLGAGIDAYPLCSIASTLGWYVQLIDHRVAYVNKATVAKANELRQIKPKNLAEQLNLDKVDAAVLMSHNVEADVLYLGQLLPSHVPYLGLLGPRYRGEELLSRYQSSLSEHEGRVFSPVGLDLGGEGPGSIALSIVAQVQAHKAQANASALSFKPISS